MRLARSAVAAGYRLETFETLGSTNDEAMDRARHGDAGRLWVVAGAQTKGRGRSGRTWTSPPGNLYASLLLVDPSPFAAMPQLGFVAGLALLHAVRPLVGNDVELAIKWPNDLLHGGAKCAGLLLEGARLADGRSACVIGFGVNCISHPEVAYPTTDLASVGASCSAADVFEALSHEWPLWLARWDRGAGFARIREAWLANARGVNDPVRIARGDESIEGVFQTIDMQGRLVIGTGQGTRTIEAGDVFLPNTFPRPQASATGAAHG